MTVLKSSRGPFAIPRSFRAIFALIMREMETSYSKSSAGYLWAIMEPVGGILILTLAFSVIMRTPALGESFPLFYATGMLPFTFYRAMEGQISSAIPANKKLLFYPRVTYMDALISRFVLTLLTQLLVALLIFTGIFKLEGLSQHINVVDALTAFLLAAFLGAGIGSLNSVLIHLMPSWKQIWGLISRPLFLASCIFYIFDSLPELAQKILWYNPLVHIIGLARRGFYATYRGDYIVLAYPILVSSISLLLGLLLLRRYAQDIIND